MSVTSQHPNATKQLRRLLSLLLAVASVAFLTPSAAYGAAEDDFVNVGITTALDGVELRYVGSSAGGTLELADALRLDLGAFNSIDQPVEHEVVRREIIRTSAEGRDLFLYTLVGPELDGWQTTTTMIVEATSSAFIVHGTHQSARQFGVVGVVCTNVEEICEMLRSSLTAAKIICRGLPGLPRAICSFVVSVTEAIVDVGCAGGETICHAIGDRERQIEQLFESVLDTGFCLLFPDTIFCHRCIFGENPEFCGGRSSDGILLHLS